MNLIQVISQPLAAGTWHQMPHAASRDQNLTLEARGLLAYMLSRGTGWQMTEAERRVLGLGRDKARRLLAQLEAAGYLVREYVRDPITKRFTATTWQVRQIPAPRDVAEAAEGYQPQAENPCADEPPTENPAAAFQSPATRRESVESDSRPSSVESSVVREKESSRIDACETDDDDLFSFLQQFGKFTEAQKALFEAQRQRLGDAAARRVVMRVLNRPAVTRTIPYLLTSLVNEPVPPPPSSAPPPAPDNAPWRMDTPHPDAVDEFDTRSDDVDADSEPQLTLEDHLRWQRLCADVRGALGDSVYSVLRDAKNLRAQNNIYTAQISQKLDERTIEYINRLLDGWCVNFEVVQIVNHTKPPTWLYPEYAGGAS